MATYADIPQAMNILLTMEPSAICILRGSQLYPSIKGTALFFPLAAGTLLFAHVANLPTVNASCGKAFFGFHLHEGSSCSGTDTDPFANTGGHYNPTSCEHPYHAGDLPPLLSNEGEALSMFYINSFLPDEVIGRTLVIHDMPDDFHTQPSGDSGMKIACGEITLSPSYRPIPFSRR